MSIRATCDVTAEDMKQMAPRTLYEIYEQAREISHRYHLIAGAESFARRALNVLKRRLKSDPCDVEATVCAALLADAAEQRNVCRSLLDRIRALTSEPLYLARHRYLTSLFEGSYSRTMTRLREALAFDPGYAEAAIALSESVMGEADRPENSEEVYDQAVERGLSIVRQALEHDPTSTKMLNYLGIMQFGADNRAAAECFRRSEVLSPLNWLNLNILAACLARSGEWEQATLLIPTIDLRKAELEKALKMPEREESPASHSEALYEIVRQAGRDASLSAEDPQPLAYLLACVQLLDDDAHSGLASEISMDLQGRAKELLPALQAKAAQRLNEALRRAGLGHLATAESTPRRQCDVRPYSFWYSRLQPTAATEAWSPPARRPKEST